MTGESSPAGPSVSRFSTMPGTGAASSRKLSGLTLISAVGSITWRPGRSGGAAGSAGAVSADGEMAVGAVRAAAAAVAFLPFLLRVVRGAVTVVMLLPSFRLMCGVGRRAGLPARVTAVGRFGPASWPGRVVPAAVRGGAGRQG